MSRTRVKICGITRIEDADAACRAGADAIGLVFFERSSRCVTAEAASRIVDNLDAFTASVGLFVDPSAQEVRDVLRAVRLDRLQFHGDEPEDFCASFGLPYIKALRASPEMDFEAQARRYHSARAILLDSYKPGVAGGTGETFDWERIPVALRQSIILAGGLKPANVAEAIRTVAPAAVDVSGGVESEPGIKSADKIQAFIEAVNCE